MATTLDELPPEMIVHVLSFLPLSDQLRVSAACTAFHTAANSVYQAQHQKQLESCIAQPRKENDNFITFPDVRQSLFDNYTFLLGTWKIISTCYGGLLDVKFDGFKLVGTRHLPPPAPHISQPLRHVKVFTVQLMPTDQCQYVCHCGYNEPHLAVVEKTDAGGFRVSCANPELHAHREGEKVEHSIWLCEELGMQKNSQELHVLSPLLQEKFETLRQEESALEFERLLIPTVPRNEVGVNPGLFLGTYGDHGLEIVMLTYEEDKKAVVTKITGDPNIPAGKVTITIDLSKPIYLTEEQQFILQDPNFFGVPPPQDDATPPVQPFRIPFDYNVEGMDQMPSTCVARFISQGQIAAPGYDDPSFIDGHWIVFTGNSFGHIWMLLHSFSMYSRITQRFM